MLYTAVMDSTAVDRENTWLSIHEAAEKLGVNPRTVRRYVKLGRLEVSRISNKVVRIRLADIDRFMEGGVAVSSEKPATVVHAPTVRQSPRPAAPARPSVGKFG